MNVSAQENALPQEEKAGGNQEQPRITGNADEIGAAESNVKAILSSVYIANPELGTPGLLTPSEVKINDSLSSGEGKDEEASVSVSVKIPGLSSITVPRLRDGVIEALFAVPFIRDHYARQQISTYDIARKMKGLVEEAIAGLPEDKQGMLQQWLKNNSDDHRGYNLGLGEKREPAVSEDEANCLSMVFSVYGSHPTEKDITATRFVLENIESLKPSILQKIRDVVEEKNKEHQEKDGTPLLSQEEMAQLEKLDLDLTDASSPYGGTVTVTLGTRVEGEKKLAATPLSKLNGKVIGKIIDDTVMNEGEKAHQMFSLIASPRQVFDKLGEWITDPELKKKREEMSAKAEEEQHRWDSGVISKEEKPAISVERAGGFKRDAPADTLEIYFSVPKGKTYADVVKALAGYDVAVANDNVDEKGDALGALIKSAAIRREDGDGGDKPKGPFGSPGDEPKPGGGDVNHEVAANSDAANSNIAAGAEHEGRVSEPKKRQVS